jgi:putative ABC transport system permease protein
MLQSQAVDLKFALRSLSRSPDFTLVAVLVMALGIGANTAVFSVVNAVLLKPLAYRDPDRIVALSSLWKKDGSHGYVSAPDFHDWHDQSTAFTAMAYYKGYDTAVAGGSAAEYGHAAAVTPEFFRVFGVEPAVGRMFVADEVAPGSAGAAVISYAYWQSHFEGKAGAVGKTLRMLDKTLTVVGVLPPGFHFPGNTDIWFPADTITAEVASRGGHNYLVAGRLKSDISLEQAQAQMASIGARLERQYSASNAGKSVAVTRLRDEMVSNVRLMLYLMLAAVGVVLLIACANIANLLLARATARTREIAIRAAVGATRGRIVRQLITESMALALAAGLAGLILASWGSDGLVALAPSNVPRLGETGIDGRVLAFTLGVSIVASLLFGLAPALQISRADLNVALKQGSARAVGAGAAGRIRKALVIAEIALSVVLLAGAGLLIKSFGALHNVALGFRPENVLVMETSVPASDLESSRGATRFYKGLLADIATLPGVSAAGAAMAPPGRVESRGGYAVDHLPFGVGAPQAVFSVVAPGTFVALGIPLTRGRDFQDGDTYNAPFIAIINEALARMSFPGQDPIGRVIFCGLDSLNPMKIAGVVGDVRQYGPAVPPSPEIYMPYEQHPRAATALRIVVRTGTEPGALSEAMRRKARERSADVPVKFTSMQAALSENIAPARFRTLLLGVFAGIAVCLAMAGVYGVMAYTVSQRSSEIGLRMALGASPGDVARMVLRQGLALASIGVLLGLAGAIAATRLLTSMLFEVQPTDPITYAGVAIVLGVVSLAASYLPARRAAKVDPLVALRQE